MAEPFDEREGDATQTARVSPQVRSASLSDAGQGLSELMSTRSGHRIPCRKAVFPGATVGRCCSFKCVLPSRRPNGSQAGLTCRPGDTS